MLPQVIFIIFLYLTSAWYLNIFQGWHLMLWEAWVHQSNQPLVDLNSTSAWLVTSQIILRERGAHLLVISYKLGLVLLKFIMNYILTIKRVSSTDLSRVRH